MKNIYYGISLTIMAFMSLILYTYTDEFQTPLMLFSYYLLYVIEGVNERKHYYSFGLYSFIMSGLIFSGQSDEFILILPCWFLALLLSCFEYLLIEIDVDFTGIIILVSHIIIGISLYNFIKCSFGLEMLLNTFCLLLITYSEMLALVKIKADERKKKNELSKK